MPLFLCHLQPPVREIQREGKNKLNSRLNGQQSAAHRWTKSPVAKDHDDEGDEIAQKHGCIDIRHSIVFGVGHLLVELDERRETGTQKSAKEEHHMLRAGCISEARQGNLTISRPSPNDHIKTRSLLICKFQFFSEEKLKSMTSGSF